MTAVEWAMRVAGSIGAAGVRDARPYVDQPAERRQRPQARVERPARRSSPARCRRGRRRSRPAARRQVGLGRVHGRVGAEDIASSRLSGEDAVAITRPAPQARASWTATVPTPPAAACTTTDSPAARWAQLRSSVPGGDALQHHGQGRAVLDPVGNRPGQHVGGPDLLGVPAAGEQADDPPPVRPGPGELGARHHRQLLRGEVAVLRLVRVGVVDAGRGHVVDGRAGQRVRLGHVGDLEHLGAPTG